MVPVTEAAVVVVVVVVVRSFVALVQSTNVFVLRTTDQAMATVLAAVLVVVGARPVDWWHEDL